MTLTGRSNVFSHLSSGTQLWVVWEYSRRCSSRAQGSSDGRPERRARGAAEGARGQTLPAGRPGRGARPGSAQGPLRVSVPGVRGGDCREHDRRTGNKQRTWGWRSQRGARTPPDIFSNEKKNSPVEKNQAYPLCSFRRCILFFFLSKCAIFPWPMACYCYFTEICDAFQYGEQLPPDT